MIRRMFAAIGLAAMIAVLMPAGPAHARVCKMNHQCTTMWYSDSSHTTVVGGLYEECDGSVYQWGVRSGYGTFVEVPC